MHRSSTVLAIALSLTCTLAAARDASAKRKAKAAGGRAAPACGLDFLPLVEGAEWTYEFSAADSPSADPETAVKGVLRLDIPPKLTIRVVKVSTRGSSSEITLEESFRKVTVTTKITCDEESVKVDPSSFFASGEPGGGLGMEIQNFKRGDSPTYMHTKGKLQNGEMWREDVTFDVVRPPTAESGVVHAPAKVELERAVKVFGREATSSALGQHPKAIKIDLQLTGRAWVVDKDKSVNIAAAEAAMWFEPQVGLVRALNGAGHAWQLSATKRPDESAAPAKP